MSEQPRMIHLENISKEYDGVTVLNDINLYIRKKEFVTLLGPSGCGKTTTLRIIGGFEYPSTGRVMFEGKDITSLPPYKRRVNTVFQKYALFPHLNVHDNIAFGLKIKKMSRGEIDKRVDKMLNLVNMQGYGKRSVDSLSGGQQQRIAIARSLVNEPEVLLLDEPLGALDLKLRKGMQLELKSMQQQLGITFLYVTHDQEEALTMSDRIAIMHDGVVDQLASPTDIYEHPATRFVATFIGETNIYDGCITGMKDGVATVTLENGAVKVGCDESFSILEYATVSVRPEKMRFDKKPHEGFELIAIVKGYIYVGSVLKCIVSLPNGNELRIERLAGQELPEVGSIIYPYWEPKDGVLIHNESYKIFKALDEIKLA